jgi:ATP-binding cassette subfamily F protein 3
VAGQTVRPFDGDIDDYRRTVLGKADGTGAQTREPDRGPTQKDMRRGAALRREALAPLRKKIKDCERALDTLRREIADLDRQLADPALYSDNDRAAALAKARSERVHAFARAESDWLDLSEHLEAEEAGERVA